MRRSHKFKKNKKTSVAKIICCVIVLGFLYFIYLLHNKTTSQVNYVNNTEIQLIMHGTAAFEK